MISVISLVVFVWLVIALYIFRAPLIRSIQKLIEKGSKLDE